MKISTRFAAIGAACALVSAAIGGALVASGQRVTEQLRDNRAAADIVESAANLRYLTLEYLRQPAQRVESQWMSAHRTLGGALARSPDFGSKREQASLAAMRAAYDDMTRTFPELIGAQRARQAGQGDRETLDELLGRLTAATVGRTLVLMTESFRLQDISREEMAATQRSVLVAVIALSAALVIVVTGGMILAFRSIARPLARLSEGTRRVGAGDLEHTIGLQGDDELAVLAREFDKMSARLRATTVSRDRLAESEERTRLIIDTALDAVIGIDVHGAIIGWNPQAEAVFGWKRAEVLGRLLSETIIPPAYRQAHRQGLARYLKTGEGPVLGRRVELSALRRDGGEFPIELSITPIRSRSDVSSGAGGGLTFSAFLRDITERKHAEARIQAQLARLGLLNQITRAIGERQDLQSIYQVAVRSLEDRMPADFCCVCRYDGPGTPLTVIRVGVRSQALTMELAMAERAAVTIDENGLSRCVRGELVYEADVEKMPYAFPQRIASAGLRSMVIAPLQSESRVFGVLVVARREAGAFSSGDCEFLSQLSAHVALAARQAELHGSLQQAYDDLRQTQQAVLQQERLRALGQMASGIAHDINNAISPVMLYTENLLESESGLSPQGRSALETIARAIDDVAATVARMREFYRRREPELALTRIGLDTLVRQVVELTRARWSDMPQQRGIVVDLRLEFGADVPAVMGQQGELREALINLVFNAVDAMPGGGRLTIATHAEGDRAVLEVIDEGQGMDEDTRRRCLEPFFTTKGERGTGLGLAMVYGAARRHGAEIEIDSAPGRGTCVRLRFPSPPAGAGGPGGAMPGLAGPGALPPRMRILLVDDDPLVLKTVQDTLERDGHVVVTAHGGQEGIDAFRAAQPGPERFDVVVTDLGMPYVDGRQVAAGVKALSAPTPVILLTGWGQRLVDDGTLPEGVDHVLSKPPRLRDLRQALLACRTSA